jgi:hypothetical protein
MAVARRLAGLAVALFLFVTLVATPAPAQAPDWPSPAEQAIAKGKEGVALYEKGQWKSALALFLEADAIYHSPVLVLYAARSQRNLGRLLAARRLYRALAAEPVDPSAAEPWKKAQMDGAAELRAVEAEIPRLTVIVLGAPGARLTVDGKARRAGTAFEIDPGPHRVVLAHDGRTHTRSVTLRRGERAHNEEFDLRPPSGAIKVAGVVLTVVGGAAMIAGGIMGGVALSRADAIELPASCVGVDDIHCPPYEQQGIEQSYDGVRTLASVSDGFLFGGAAIAVVGVVLLIVDATSEETTGSLVPTVRF